MSEHLRIKVVGKVRRAPWRRWAAMCEGEAAKINKRINASRIIEIAVEFALKLHDGKYDEGEARFARRMIDRLDAVDNLTDVKVLRRELELTAAKADSAGFRK